MFCALSGEFWLCIICCTEVLKKYSIRSVLECVNMYFSFGNPDCVLTTTKNAFRKAALSCVLSLKPLPNSEQNSLSLSCSSDC